VFCDDALLKEIEGRLGIARIETVAPLTKEQTVADSTSAIALRAGRTRLILIISSAVSPLIVKRGVDRQRRAKAALQAPAQAAIELPLLEGFYGERSYALWPARRPLSANRVIRKIEKIILAPRVFHWLRAVAAQSIKPADRAVLAAQAARLESLAALPLPIRNAAGRARDAFLSGAVRPVHVLQHGDMWLGNILLAPTRMGFIVIDWPGAALDGVPFYDLLKFSASVGASKPKLGREIAAHAAIAGCNPNDASIYVLSGLGRLHRELEYFPEASFVELCKQKLRALGLAGIETPLRNVS
jgi:hypothetical protein